MLKTKLPPYGKQLQNQIAKDGLPKNDVRLCMGLNAWDLAKDLSTSQAVLVLPPDESPYQYFWPVQSCSILVIITSEIESILIKQIAQVLLTANAAIVRVILPDYRLVIYKR